MSDLNTKIENLLGRKMNLEQSNLYELLGLTPMETDRQKIESALNATVSRLRAAKETVDKVAWERVVPRVQKAKAILLDVDKKNAYDLQLRSSTKQLALASTEKSIPTDAGFPDGDPQQAFDMASYVQGLGPGFEAEIPLEVRLDELRKDLNLSAMIWESSTASAPERAPSQPEAMATSIENPPLSPFSASSSPTRSPSVHRASSQRHRRPRAKLSSTTLLTGALVLGSLLFVLIGLGYFGISQFWKGKPSMSQKGATISKDLIPDNGSKPRNRTTTTFDVESTKFEVGPSKFEMVDPVASVDTIPTTPTAPTPSESMPVMAETPPPAVTTPTPMVSDTPGPLTPEERKRLVESLRKGRKAIDEWDFKVFEAEIATALPLAREAPFQDQLARLDQLGQLRKIFLDAVKAGVAKLSAGETFKVMNTVVAFIEGNDEFIIVKMGGESVKNPLKNLPMGIGLGLADLSLDSDAGTDLGARAAFCLLLPKQSSVSEREGKRFLEKGIQTGKIRPDLMEVFADKYE